MATGNLTLANVPGGFDVFTRVHAGDTPAPAQAPVTVPFSQQIVVRRQPQFVGSAELIFEIDGVRQAPEETGTDTAERADRLASFPGANPPFRLATQVRKVARF